MLGSVQIPAIGYLIYIVVIATLLFFVVKWDGKEFDSFKKVSAWLSGICLVSALVMSAFGLNQGAVMPAALALIFVPVDGAPD